MWRRRIGLHERWQQRLGLHQPLGPLGFGGLIEHGRVAEQQLDVGVHPSLSIATAAVVTRFVATTAVVLGARGVLVSSWLDDVADA